MVTAPYFHDGSAATVWDVMDHYNKEAGTAQILNAVKRLGIAKGSRPTGVSEYQRLDQCATMLPHLSLKYSGG
jgi:cytochrome c peroxidase